MASNQPQLRILFIPFMAPGHMIPMVDMAKLFSLRGVKSIILTTYGNSSFIPTSHNVEVHLVPFPSNNLLPKGVENMSLLKSRKERVDFVVSSAVLRPVYEEALRDIRPDVVVSDMMFPWTVEVAQELGIPRILFHGSNFFSQCASDSLLRNKSILDDGIDSVVIPNLPHRIEMPRSQIPNWSELSSEFKEMLVKIKEAESKSYGIVVNTFYELEFDYIQYYKDAIGIKMWHIGPVCLCDKHASDTANTRGNAGSVDNHDNLENWLNSQEPKSVLYISFGTLCNFGKEQLREISEGLEESGKAFVWVVRKDNDTSEWITSGLENMINEGKGVMINGWAPQELILNHISIGGFMTHCGWNSCLESITAGVSMITWPSFADQFYNEKLVVEVLKAGIMVGDPKCWMDGMEKEPIKAEMVKKAIVRLMGEGEEAQKIRKRAIELGEMARVAMEHEGSSYKSLSLMIDDLSARLSNIIP